MEHGRMQGMNAARIAYVDAFLALAQWRAHSDVEVIVAHWVIEGLASHEDLVAARAATSETKRAHTAARKRYTRVIGQRTQARPGYGPRYRLGPAQVPVHASH